MRARRLRLLLVLGVAALNALRAVETRSPSPPTAREVVSLAHELAAVDPAIARALAPRRDVTGDDSEGFVVEHGELVSAGERLRRRGFGPSLVVHLPEDARGAIDVVPNDVSAKRVRISLATSRHATRELALGTVVYRDTAPSTDVLVRADETAMQALYLLRDADAPVAFAWTLELGAELEDVVRYGDALVVRDVTGEVALRMPDGVAFDAEGNQIAVLARYDAAASTVTWSLERPPTAYPVLVDPVIEMPTWTERAPKPRFWHAMAYDAARQESVLFGGSVQGSSTQRDTWIWNGHAWREAVSAERSSSYGHAMAYDAARHVVVLHDSNGTAVWDGVSWQERPGTQPPSRTFHAMAYDAAREVVVLFGGRAEGATPYADTWIWDGLTWTSTTASGPSGRSGHGMAYDAAREEVVLFGGSSGARETWVWNGTSWTQRTPETAPPSGRDIVLAYDAAREEVVLFGAGEIDGPSQTWTWDGETWTRRETIGRAPRNRSSATMIYDEAREEVLLFGGETGSYDGLGDLWAWNGTSWRPLQPTPRARHAMAYDAARQEVLLFGGVEGDEAIGETWVWNGEGWAERVVPLSPSPRFGLALAYDDASEQIVLFGGEDGTQTLADTWVWSGTAWTEMHPAASPSARHGHAMAYDATREETLLYGGSGQHTITLASVRNDTWAWRDGTWTERLVPRTPQTRVLHAMAYDAARAQIVVAGGRDGFGTRDEVWLWNGASWLEAVGIRPPGSTGPAMAYGAGRGEVYLFGGKTFDGLSDETYTFDGTDDWQPHPDFGARHQARARADHAMAHDDARNELVVFGGTLERTRPDAPTMVRVTTRVLAERCSTSVQCATGFCVDGVCCESACEGGADDCLTCATGRCLPSGAVCRKSAHLCDVAERCVGPSAACPPDDIAPAGTVCRAEASVCDVAETCNGSDITCPEEDVALPEGTPCGTPQGVCDAQDVCMGSSGGSATCAPRYADAGSACRPATCTEGRSRSAATCTGESDACPWPTETSCGAYACGESACLASCSADTDCALGHLCDDGVCREKRGRGAACTEDRVCTYGHCADEVCCLTACIGACESCAVPGSEGTCTRLVGAPGCPAPCVDGSDCGASEFCDAGACALARGHGESCSADAQCASHACVRNACCADCSADAGAADAGDAGDASDAALEPMSGGGGGCASARHGGASSTGWAILIVAAIIAARRASARRDSDVGA